VNSPCRHSKSSTNVTRTSHVVLIMGAVFAACLATSACTSDTTSKGVWAAAGNNGGKVDRYAVARSVQEQQANTQQ
jgi:hypothetical protein